MAPGVLADDMVRILFAAGLVLFARPAWGQVEYLRHGKGGTPYEAIYGAYLSVQRSVIWKGHKLLLCPKLKKIKLFDMKADPKEMKDLAADTSKAALRKELFAKLLELQKETGDKLDLKKVYPALSGA